MTLGIVSIALFSFFYAIFLKTYQETGEEHRLLHDMVPLFHYSTHPWDRDLMRGLN